MQQPLHPAVLGWCAFCWHRHHALRVAEMQRGGAEHVLGSAACKTVEGKEGRGAYLACCGGLKASVRCCSVTPKLLGQRVLLSMPGGL